MDDVAAGPDHDARGPFPPARADAAMASRGRQVDLEIWYPPQCRERMPTIVFGHGWRQPVARYRDLLAGLASWGFFVVAPLSYTGTFPSHEAFAGDLVSALVWAAAHDTLAGGPWQGRLRPDRLGLAGHSMGGGAAVLAAVMHPQVSALATDNAANTRPSAVEAAARLRVPMMSVVSADDRIAPAAKHQHPIFDAAPAPKSLRTVENAGHRSFMDDGPADLRVVNLRLLSLWFRYHLLDDATLEDEVWGAAARATPGVGMTAVR